MSILLKKKKLLRLMNTQTQLEDKVFLNTGR